MADDHKRLIEAAKNPSIALDYELAQEMASALGRLGRALERALQALAESDASGGASSPEARRVLVAAAGKALWEFTVQREACGLRDTRQVIRDYRVPPDVLNRTGIVVHEPMRIKKPRP